jgi:hypothetical protein
MGRGWASMQLALISLVTKQVLNKKAQGQDHFKRTLNWRKTWKDGVERFREAYTKSQGFYEAIAIIEDRAKYQRDILKRIEAFPGWESRDLLADFHNRVQKGGILTSKQMELLDKLLSGGVGRREAPSHVVVDEALLNRLRTLYVAARQKNDRWLMGFTTSIAETLKTGRPLTQQQQEALNQGFSRYRVGFLDLRRLVRQTLAVTQESRRAFLLSRSQ